MDSELKYLYRQKWSSIIFIVVFFGFCTPALFYKAQDNDRGLIINGLIELSTKNASIFYWIICAFSFVLFLFGLISVYFRVKEKKYLVISDFELIIPPVGFNRREYRILLDKINSIQEIKISGQIMLKISSEGKSRTIVKKLLENKTQYEEVKKNLKENLNENAF